jgi:hypothetical protein
MLRGSHYRAHDSHPTPEYLTDMQKQLGKPAAGDALAKATAALERLENFMAPAKPDEPLAKFETTNPVLAAALGKIDNLAKKLDDTLSAWEQSRRSPRETSRDIERPAAPVRVET